MTILKLDEHKYANAKVILHENGTITLVSYRTPVIEAIPHGKALGSYELYCSGTYSRTTIKHIGWFMREYFNLSNYYDMKNIAGTGEYHITKLTKRMPINKDSIEWRTI